MHIYPFISTCFSKTIVWMGSEGPQQSDLPAIVPHLILPTLKFQSYYKVDYSRRYTVIGTVLKQAWELNPKVKKRHNMSLGGLTL